MSVTPIFRKLNFKDQDPIVVLDAPRSFESELARIAPVRVIRDASRASRIDFAIAFVMTAAELDRASSALISGAGDDPLLWFAYPKQTSRRYTCEFNRDSGWDVLRSAGFDSVRMVAIDEDWSALRFRRVQHIRKVD